MAKDQFRGWEVRDFWAESNTKLVLVKGSKTKVINVRSANFAKGKWIFSTMDGVKITLRQARKKIQYLKSAEIVTNCVFFRDEVDYDRVGGDYSELDLGKSEYHVACMKRCFLRKRFHISSPIKKIWKEQGKYHTITLSGAHYVFPIR